MPLTEKSREALLSVLAALFLFLVKLAVGLWSGSLGILAEATNSALDILASLITLVAVRFAERPPDASHPYGHGKAENLAAFVQGLVVLLTCLAIGREALGRLVGPLVGVDISPWTFAVMLLSVAVSGWRVVQLRRSAARYGSQALEADALHFYTDIFTGAAVLVGLGLVGVGERLGWPPLARADAVAALLVVGVLLHLTVGLMRQAMDVLLDRSHSLTTEIEGVAWGVAGVEQVHSIRTREVGAESFVDMRIGVARTASFEESHAVATAVEQAVHALLPRADVVVHVDPVRPASESSVQAIHAIAQREGLPIHHITLHEVAGRLRAHLHVELPPTLRLAEAHAQVDAFEAQVLAELPELAELISHIEPTSEGIAAGADVTARARHLLALVEQITGEQAALLDCHNLTVQQVGSLFHLSLHCTFAPDATLQQVHDQMGDLERQLRNAIPALGYVTIHPEPLDER